MTLSELITLLIAVWGAFLSSILGFSRIYDRKRRLKVSAGIAYISIIDGLQEAVFSISCVNKGVRPIVLDRYGILMPKLPNIGFKDEHPNAQQFPITLVEGQTFGVLAYGRQLQPLFHSAGYTNIFEIRGYIRDTTGKIYKSKKVEIDSNQLYIQNQ